MTMGMTPYADQFYRHVADIMEKIVRTQGEAIEKAGQQMKRKKSDRPGDCPKDYPGIFADEEKRTGNELLYQCLICDYGK